MILRVLKGYLKLHHGHCTHCISDKARIAKEEWQAAQHHLDNHPDDKEASSREREACYCYNKLSADEECFFRQRSRVQWLKLGDKNTAFFHRSVMHRRARNQIHSLRSETGEEPLVLYSYQ
ncbi:hypothetical protein OIU84_017603 [Salix udensis]|uniref:Uncharacterized protein n=1 Tax=Salix udensis TaxID=889485 RepID=A0AAD6L4G1_9ROSI|nr:hypothetical protein OIU84_017603 [Salix udensis]